MKKQLALIGALFLACGMGSSVVNAAPAPQVVNTNTTTVSGTVVDENGEPVIGASIAEIGTIRATATDVNGHFSLKVGPKAKLQISYIGYKTTELPATDNMKVTMQSDAQVLNEVVVTGYTTQRKADLTGATLFGIKFNLAHLRGAMFCTDPGLATVFPFGFNPKEHGMIEVDVDGKPIT